MISDVLKIVKTVYLDILFATTFLLSLYLNGVDAFWMGIAACGVIVLIFLLNIKYYIGYIEQVKLFINKYLAEFTLVSLLVTYFLLNSVDLQWVAVSITALIVSLLTFNSDNLRIKIVNIFETVLGRKKESILIGLVILLMVLLDSKLDLVVFVTIFFSFLFYKWDSRITAFGAIVCLLLCPPLLFLEYGLVAEQMAVYAYYFLVITVILQIVEFKRNEKSK